MILLGIIAIGLAAASPFLAAMVAMKVSEGIVAISQKNLIRLKQINPSQKFLYSNKTYRFNSRLTIRELKNMILALMEGILILAMGILFN